MATKKKPLKHEYCGKPACKQCWGEYKTRSRTERHDRRARATVIPPQSNLNRGARLHDCSHALKHHKASGRCRKGCECTYALDRAARKDRAA